MPAWGTLLPSTVIWDLVAYIRSISNASSPQWGTTPHSTSSRSSGSCGVPIDADPLAIYRAIQLRSEADRRDQIGHAHQLDSQEADGREPPIAMPDFSAVTAGNLFAALAAHAETPMTFLRSFGNRRDAILPLTWGLMIISMRSSSSSSACSCAGCAARTAIRTRGEEVQSLDPVGGVGWIYIGVAISAVVLFAVLRCGPWSRSPPWAAYRKARIHYRGHGPPMVVAGPLSQRPTVPHLHHRQRDPHPGRRYPWR